MPDCEVHVYDDAAHCPHIEHAEKFNAAAVAFLKKLHAKNGIAATAA
jgi:pimeloyl-ACP methyl ester carboxylesterase